MKRSIFMLTILLAIAAFSIAPVMAPCLPMISKRIYCPTGPGYSDNYLYLDHGIPVYPAGEKLVWWIEIKVTAGAAMEDVVVYDRLGAEFMVEGIYDGAIAPLTPEPPLTYTFDYGKDTLVDTILPGQDVSVDGVDGTVDKDGITFGDFFIYWTGNSCKIHFQWNIGDMTAGETEVMYLVISTDLNPAGHQEFTSCGTYFLNSGATVKGFVNGRQVSAEAAPIPIKVVDD